jgi:N-methylhydantoinase B
LLLVEDYMNPTAADLTPTTVEVIRNQLVNISEEMQARVMNSAYSSMWQEAGDLSAALLSPRAEVAGQSQRAIPIHVATMVTSVGQIVEQTGGYDALEEGDILIQNDPYSGNNHLPDFVVAEPVFHDGSLLGFSAVRGHWLDVGGSSPTSYAIDTGEILKEGLRVPPAKLYEAGERNDALYRVIFANVRDSDERVGDFNAQLAGVRQGRRRLQEVAEKYGAETVRATVDRLLDNDERRMRSCIEALPDGDYEAEDFLDGDGIEDELLRIHATVRVRGSDIEVDFTGTDGQVSGGINAPPSVTRAATHYGIKCTLNPGILRTSGEFRPVDIDAPRRSLVNPEHPAPVVAGNHETANRVFDTVVRAIGTIDADLVFGAGEGSTNGLTYRSLETKVANRTRGMGGAGACATRDGINGIRSGVGNTGIEPVERFEERYEYVTIDEFAIVTDTGGGGRFRGGNATRLTTRFADDVELIVTSDRAKTGPYGVAGGGEGARARHVHVTPDGERHELPSKCSTTLDAGSAFELQPAGGGGYGDPHERPPERVLEDVLDGYITAETALETYGVAVSGDPLGIDWETTEGLRDVE